MKKSLGLRFLMLVLCCFVAVSAFASKMYIMVEKAELHSEPNINSPIVGYVYKSDKPIIGDYNSDGSWVKTTASGSNKSGWVMSCICKEGNNESYGFDYETCYAINKALAKGEISQETFAVMLSKLQNSEPDYGGEECYDELDILEVDADTSSSVKSTIEDQAIIICAIIILWLLSIGSFVLSLLIPKLRTTGVLLLLLGLCELCYVLLPDSIPNFPVKRMIELVVITGVQLILLILNRFDSRNALEKLIARTTIVMMIASIVIFVWRYGVGNFFVSLVEAVIGIILLVILFAIVRMVIKAPPSKPQEKKEKEEEEETCSDCRYFDSDYNKCLYWGDYRGPGGSCGHFRR